MKRKIKNYCGNAALLLMALLLVYSCETDYTTEDLVQETGNNNISFTKFSELHEVQIFVNQIQNEKNLSSRNSSEGNNFTIVENKDIYTYKDDSSTTYTISIVKENQEPNSFSNLIVKFNDNGETTAKIMNYYPEQEYLNAYYNDPLTPFKGKASYEPIGYEDALDGLHSRSITCTHITIIYCSYEYTHVAGPSCSEHTYPVTYTVCTLDEVEPPVIEAPDEENTGGGGSNTNPTPPNLCQPISKDGNLGDVNILGDTEDCVEEEEAIDLKIDDSELVGKEKCINNHMNRVDTPFIRDILKNFNGETSEFDINIKSQEKVFTNEGKPNQEEVRGQTSYRSDSKVLQIKISSSQMTNSRALQVARTLLHEYIHAEMFRKLYTAYPTSGEILFRATFENYEGEEFAASAQHETMAALYVNLMRDALKDFHKKVLVGDYNYLTDNGANPLPDDFYEALAWQGLKINDVKAWVDLPQFRKDEINAAYAKHIFSTTHNCP